VQRGPCTGDGPGGGKRTRTRLTSTAKRALRAPTTSRRRRARSSCRGRLPGGSGGQCRSASGSSNGSKLNGSPATSAASARSPHIRCNRPNRMNKSDRESEGSQPNSRRRIESPRVPTAGASVRRETQTALSSAARAPLGALRNARAPWSTCPEQAARALQSWPSRQRPTVGSAEPRKRAVAAFSGRPGRTGYKAARFRALTLGGFAGWFDVHERPP
jgi:hypothetical protein